MDRTITLPNFRTTADVTMNTRLKDGGVYVDWAGLTDIKAWLYSDAQKTKAGRCVVSINQADSTKLVCEYSATKPQYLGVQRLIVQAKYMGRTKTYDKPVFNFVPRTADQNGTQIVIDDPVVDVEISVEDVSSSLIEQLVADCIKATEEAQEVVDTSRGPRGFSAYEVAVQNGFEGTEEEWLLSLRGKSAYEIAVELGYEGTEEQWIASLKGEDGDPGTTPHIGQNGNWFIGDVDTGVAAGGQNGVTPHIGQNGNWFIGDTDTGVLARGTNGVTPHIGDNGHWFIGETDTGVLAEGTNGVTPHIGNNGHWFIGDTDTNVVAEGQDGNPGITPHIGANNHWFIGTTDTGVLAEGTDGVTPHIGDNGHWYIGDVDTGVIGEGHDGVGFDDASTPEVADGTFIIILSNGDTVRVDLNHEHPENYSKLVDTSQPQGGFLPDVIYKLGTLTGSVTFALAAAVTGNANHYFIVFETGSTAPTIVWPSGLTWVDGSAPAPSANKHCEVSIMDGIAAYLEV